MTAAASPDGYVQEVEQEVLGALLFGGDYRNVAGFLREEHFLADAHRQLYRAIGAAHEQYGSTTVPVVARLITTDMEPVFVKETGDKPLPYMAGLSECIVFGAPNIVNSAKAVIRQWVRIRTGTLGSAVASAALDPAADPKKLIQGIASDLDDLAAELRSRRSRKTLVTLDEATDAALDEVRAAMARGTSITGHTWGLTDINQATGGIQPAEMAVIGARPSMGKTALALSVALRTAGSGVGVGFISLEMSSSKLAMRRLTDVAYDWNCKVPYTDLIKGRVSEADLEVIEQCRHDADNLPLWIEEQPGLTIGDIRVKIDRMAEQAQARRVPLGVLIVDYLQLVRPSSRYAGNRVGEITEISASLREFSREYQLGVIALSQLSRSVETRDDKRPQLSDLRDSGAIEQDADLVAFLYREAYYLEKAKGKDNDKETERVERLIEVQNDLEFIIAKQRNGPTKTVKLFVDIACSAVRNKAVF